jgi:RimJ/RimL family protein N-acetyltransferase
MKQAITLRKFNSSDLNSIQKIAEQIAQKATSELLVPDITDDALIQNGLGRLVKYRGVQNSLIPAKDLFCPYSPLQFPFDKSARQYLETSNYENLENPQTNIHLAITDDSLKLIGGVSLGIDIKTIGDYEYIGDIGYFLTPSSQGMFISSTALAFASILSYQGVIDNNSHNQILITATVHPLNIKSIKLLNKLGFASRKKIYYHSIYNDYRLDYFCEFDTYIRNCHFILQNTNITIRYKTEINNDRKLN